MNFLSEAADSLAKDSPYGITLVFIMIIFLRVHKYSLNQLNLIFNKAFEEVKNNNHQALDEMRKTMSILTKERKM